MGLERIKCFLGKHGDLSSTPLLPNAHTKGLMEPYVPITLALMSYRRPQRLTNQLI